MYCEKLRLLLWKNWVLQKKRPLSTIAQILLPVLFVTIVAWSNSSIHQYFLEDEVLLPDVSIKMPNFALCNKRLTSIYYWIWEIPDSEEYQDIERLVEESFKEYAINIEKRSELCHFLNENNEIPDIHDICIYLKPSNAPDKLVFNELIKSNLNDSLCELMVQHVVERTFVRSVTNALQLRPIILQSFPYASFQRQNLENFIAITLPVMLVFSMFFVVGSIVKGVASERQSGMKELMKIMGLSGFIHWTSWFLKSIILTTIIYTIVTVLLCTKVFEPAIFEYTDFFIIWLFLFIYCIDVISFSFMISTFFHKASSAANIGIMLFFTTYIPFYVFGQNFDSMSYFVKVTFLLLVNTAFGQGITMILSMELNMKGVNFNNLFNRYEGFNFSLGEVMIVMLLSSTIHILMTYYIESVFPGDFGVPKPWNFPFTNCANLMKRRESEINDHIHKYRTYDDFEEEPNNLNVKVKIVNLTKKFGSFTAVKRMNLNIYEDQITVLLGHNGGGKTTTMNMLTGMLPPTHGTAFINGYDIKSETAKARKSLGICPQHNVLFDDLTVEEHIIFFCCLKGMRQNKKIRKEIKKYLKLMDFVDKRHKKSKTLSGGQKRKLSIANALCANSQFIVLDEPTSGLDVNARRNLWNLLLSEKKGRTILLTTHYMDEAEVLGDRIAIMSEGVLKTVGTSFFLKKKFGSGYRLIVVKAPNCDSMKILKVIKVYAPDVSIESEEQMEVIFSISDEYVDKFDKLFSNLESSSKDLGIESLGCSLATLEDVFLKIGEVKSQSTSKAAIAFNNLMSFKTVPVATLWFNQNYAFILKKIHFLRRSYVQLLLFSILTIWFLFTFIGTSFQIPAYLNPLPKLSGIIQNIDADAKIIESYKSIFNGLMIEVTHRDIRELIYGNFLKRNQKYQIGVTYSSTSDVIWYNQHSFRFNKKIIISGIDAIALNYYHRALLKNGSSSMDILRSNPFDKNDSFSLHEYSIFNNILIYLLFIILLMFWSSLHITLKIKERITRSKLLQFISGANRFLFTFTSFLMDSLITIAILFIIVGIVASTGRDGFNTFKDASVYLVAITFYVMNVVPLIYIMSFWFKKQTTGETNAALFPIAFIILYIVYWTFENIYSNHSLASRLYWIGMFFGPFSLMNIFNKLQSILFFGQGEIWSFGERGIGINLMLMSIGTVIFLIIILLKDFHFFKWFGYIFSQRSKRLPPISLNDDDVLKERKRIRASSWTELKEFNLSMRGLSKCYGKFVAVNQLYVGVESAECFGLLGVNGAGKTSVFKMLTGDEKITYGDAWIHGYSIKNEISKVYSEIGYCPQYDALLDELTGRETMKIFCLLRGIPLHQIRDITESFANELDFTRYLDVQVGRYSGGNKRKLSTCLSLLGNLSLVFLDECSSGIDARAKRQLWNAIKQARGDGKSIVISSHSMQECESLCTRLAIMVDGEFQCIGSIQHIKNKFAKGFILKIMMSQRDDEELVQKINDRILKTFPMAKLKERFMGLLTFHIDLPEVKWSQVFAELSKMKTELGISDYTLTQSSLESVFLLFSQQKNNQNTFGP